MEQGEYASVNSFPVSDPSQTVPLVFILGFRDAYSLVAPLNFMDENVFLEDLITSLALLIGLGAAYGVWKYKILLFSEKNSANN